MILNPLQQQTYDMHLRTRNAKPTAFHHGFSLNGLHGQPDLSLVGRYLSCTGTHTHPYQRQYQL